MNALTVVPGSLAAVAAENGGALVEPPVAVVLVDISYSMEEADATNKAGQRAPRFMVANEQLADLQARMPGKIALLAFADEPVFCPNGEVPAPCGLTNLAGALAKAREADTGAMRFVLISDGIPDSERRALEEAQQFTGAIDCIYIGQDDEGARFLRTLAKLTGGTCASGAGALGLLSATVQRLLLTAGS